MYVSFLSIKSVPSFWYKNANGCSFRKRRGNSKTTRNRIGCGVCVMCLKLYIFFYLEKNCISVIYAKDVSFFDKMTSLCFFYLRINDTYTLSCKFAKNPELKFDENSMCAFVHALNFEWADLIITKIIWCFLNHLIIQFSI